MAYTKYSLTPADNNAAPPNGAPEGMLPSAVNDTMRDMMAQIRDCGDGIRGGTYTMTSPVITGGSISGSTMSSNVITGGSINNTPIGASTANTGAFTTLSASSTVSGAGFSNYFASPPALGGTAAAAVSSTNLSYTGTLTGGTGVVNLGSGQFYKDASGNVGIGLTGGAFRLGVQDASSATRVYIANSANAAGGAGVYMQVFNGASVVTDNTIRSDNVGNMAFFTGTTSGSERMRIDSSGNLLVGTTTYNSANAGILCSANGKLYATANGIAAAGFNRLTNDGIVVEFQRSTTVVGSVSVTTTATAYNTSSDYRLKENIAPMQNALNVVQQLKPVTYNWKADGSDGQGFIAHELAEIVPDCVTGEKDAVDEEGNPVYQGIDTSFLVATLTAAIQELKAQVDAQALEIQALKAK